MTSFRSAIGTYLGMHWSFIAQTSSKNKLFLRKSLIVILRSRYGINLAKRWDSGRCLKICSPATPTPKWWLLRPSPWVEVEELGLGLTPAPSSVTVLLTHESWLLMEVGGAVFVLVSTVDKRWAVVTNALYYGLSLRILCWCVFDKLN